VRIDGMQPDVAVKMSNLKELPETDFCPVSEEPPEAPHAYGLYFSGDPVLVERSDGSQSECTIVEYDEVFETFTVNIGGAVCKYGVEESYIKAIEDMSLPAGEFHIGRRVRVRKMEWGAQSLCASVEIVTSSRSRNSRTQTP
jgi:hypothetical protein